MRYEKIPISTPRFLLENALFYAVFSHIPKINISPIDVRKL